MVIVVMEVENINGVKEHPCPELAGSLSQNHPVAAVACVACALCSGITWQCVCGCAGCCIVICVVCAGTLYCKVWPVQGYCSVMCVAVRCVVLKGAWMWCCNVCGMQGILHCNVCGMQGHCFVMCVLYCIVKCMACRGQPQYAPHWSAMLQCSVRSSTVPAVRKAIRKNGYKTFVTLEIYLRCRPRSFKIHQRFRHQYC